MAERNHARPRRLAAFLLSHHGSCVLGSFFLFLGHNMLNGAYVKAGDISRRKLQIQPTLHTIKRESSPPLFLSLSKPSQKLKSSEETKQQTQTNKTTLEHHIRELYSLG